MAFDWALYVKLADELIKYQRTTSYSEAYLRTSISRSYYGVFCIARNFLVTAGTTIPRANTHKSVREEYLSSSDRPKQIIGKNLGRLWRKRKNADYENIAFINIDEAKLAHAMAIQTMSELINIGAI
ncbi:MAG TPA: hypothetical protein VNL73_06715 [Verrucomicrobiae bacterium]|nr:hypothetical protein [Verrucomicrobiae bacterium]